MIRINLLKTEKKGKKTSTAGKAAGSSEPARTMDVGLGEAPYRKEKPSFPPMALVVLLAIVAAAALYFTQASAISKERDMLAQLRIEKTQLQDVVRKLADLERRKQLLNNKINLIRDLQTKQGAAVIVLDELSRNLPQWVWLTEVRYNNLQLDITGRALENNLIADYILYLENSEHIGNVELLSSSQRSDRNNTYFEFKLKARFTGTLENKETNGEGANK